MEESKHIQEINRLTKENLLLKKKMDRMESNLKKVENNFDMTQSVLNQTLEEIEKKNEAMDAEMALGERNNKALQQRMSEIAETRLAMLNLMEDFETARTVAEEATKAKSTFLAGMSHEIRTPMNAVIGLSHLALQTDLNPKQYDYVYKIQSSGKALLGIINDILDFSKIEAGKLTTENTDFDLEKVFHDVATVITYKAHEKGLEVVFDIDNNVPLSLNGDPLRIGQILINLANNAVKFTNEGEISISVVIEKEVENDIWLKFTIHDTGIGLTQDQIAKLFQSFSQADSGTTRKFGGTGLGLAISKQLSELMGGRIWVESEYGKGSAFIFTIRAEKLQKQKLTKMIPAVDLRDLNVLVCDDNSTSLEVLSNMLTSLTFKVKAVSSGEEALAELENETKQPYQLVLLDWKMPGMDGLEVAEKIKNNIKLAKTPTIIMVTAYTRDEIISKVDELKLAGLLTKPVSHSTMFDAIMLAFGKEVQQKHSGGVKKSIYEAELKKLQGARILLVEDNDINQQVAGELLESAGFIVEIAGNGKEALDRINKKADFDLIFMDLQMPVMDGITASEELRKNKEFDKIPIIAMTADVVGEVKDKCFEIGMNDFIPKPINPEHVFESIIKWIKPGERDLSKLKPKTEKATTESIEIPELNGIDIKDGLNRVGDNRKLYQNLLFRFYDNNINLIEQIKKAYNSENEETALRLIHTVKGVSGNIGAIEFHKTTQVLEKNLKEKNYTDLNKLLDEYALDLKPILETIATYKNSLIPLKPKQLDDVAELNKEVFNKLLDELKTMLEDNDLDATSKVEELFNLPGLGVYNEKIKKIEKALDDFDFDEALDILKKHRDKNFEKIDNSIK